MLKKITQQRGAKAALVQEKKKEKKASSRKSGVKEEREKLGKGAAKGSGEGGCVLKSIDTIITIHFKKLKTKNQTC